MRLGCTDGQFSPGAAVPGVELSGEVKGGADFCAPVGMAVCPCRQDEGGIGVDMGRSFPGVLEQPLLGAFRQQGGEPVSIEIGINAGVQPACGDIEITTELNLCVIKVGMKG